MTLQVLYQRPDPIALTNIYQAPICSKHLSTASVKVGASVRFNALKC